MDWGKEGLWCGTKHGKNITWNHSGIFKLLGIKYNFNKTDIYEDNFTEKLNKVKKLLQNWSFRNLSIIGKVTVVKTLALPILVQFFTVLSDSPNEFFKGLDKIIFHFIWAGKTDKIKRSVMINEYEKGGLKVPNTRLFAKSLKLTWDKKYFDVDNKNPWKELLQKELKTVAGDNFWYFTKTGLQ